MFSFLTLPSCAKCPISLVDPPLQAHHSRVSLFDLSINPKSLFSDGGVQVEQFKQRVRNEIALQNAQELMNVSFEVTPGL